MGTMTSARGWGVEADVGRLGRLCAWAGLLGAATGILLAVAPPSVADDRYSYPLSPTGFALIQAWFVVQHLGLLAGIVGLGRSSAGPGRRLGVSTAAAGMVLLTLTEAVAITAARSSYPGPRTGLLDALYGVAVVAIGVGLAAAGIALLRRRAWSGRRRWVPLATGAYVFVPMLPLMFAGFVAARLVITGWMLLFALLGWALAQEEAA